jgi:tetratricopeptide (TPR) repeat protein
MEDQNSPKETLGKADALYKTGDFGKAADLYREIAEQYSSNGKTIDAAEMLNNYSVSLLQKGDAKNAYEAAKDTDKIFQEAGDVRRQAIALGNQASALEAMGDLKGAILLYQQSSDLLKSIDDKDLRVYVLKSLSALQVRTGDQLQAMASMDAALQLQKKLTLKEKFLKKLLGIPFKSSR